MLTLLVLFMLVVIVFQISISTTTDARIARNQTAVANMDHAIESVLLQIFEDLAADAEASAGAGGGGGGGGLGGLAGGGGGGLGDAAGAEESGGGPTDSSRDEWARPGRYELNDLTLRILIQDEDSKYNVLSLLTENEDEADKARRRVVRILDLCREGTSEDIDPSEAEEMVDAMIEHFSERDQSILPRPLLLTDDEEDLADEGLPMSLRELVVLEEFDESHFRDYRDEDGTIVHSIASFLTIWTSLTTIEEAEAAAQGVEDDPGSEDDEDDGGGQASGGSQLATGTGDGITQNSGFGDVAQEGAEQAAEGDEATPNPSGDTGDDEEGGGPKVNVNRAPAAVLHGLMDDRDVSPYFWDAILDFRNEEDEEATEDDEDDEPLLDEFGREIVPKRFFRSTDDLVQIDGWERMEPIVQAEVERMLGVESQVFSIFVTARRSTSAQGDTDSFFLDAEEIREEESTGQDLMRTVRCVIWRRAEGSDVLILPLERWEVLDYVPFEILDFPDEER